MYMTAAIFCRSLLRERSVPVKKSKAKILILHLAVFLGISLYLYITVSFRIYCPFNRLTGLTCPGCGSTRALFALVRGNFSEYFAYNPFALLLLAMLFILPHLKMFGRFKSPFTVFCILTAALSFVYNLLRILVIS